MIHSTHKEAVAKTAVQHRMCKERSTDIGDSCARVSR